MAKPRLTWEDLPEADKRRLASLNPNSEVTELLAEQDAAEEAHLAELREGVRKAEERLIEAKIRERKSLLDFEEKVYRKQHKDISVPWRVLSLIFFLLYLAEVLRGTK